MAFAMDKKFQSRIVWCGKCCVHQKKINEFVIYLYTCKVHTMGALNIEWTRRNEKSKKNFIERQLN